MSRHADLVSFTGLKAFEFDQRFVGKDTHDLVIALNTRRRVLMAPRRCSAKS